ncbi:MAG: sensor histidine kinase [Clostridia bacterium]|nr:sensor histidine kinase [Clostridia bacterium]
MREMLYFLRTRRQALLLFLLCAALLMGLTGLYRLPLMAALYPLLLCAALFGLFLLREALRERRVCRSLSAITGRGDVTGAALPPAATAVEAQYRRILLQLCGEQLEDLRRMEGRCREQVDYYTAWAHQVKTPIAAMGLRLQQEDSPLARQLSTDLRRIEQYVEMALMFPRLDGGGSDYVIRACDLDGLIRACVRKFAGEFIDRRLRLDYEKTDLSVITDEKWLAFVIEQVLSNALKYAPRGTVRIHVEPPALLHISDTGIGIAPEDLPRIFEKGYTGYNGRGDKQASGIGLYLCRRICEKLGHTITAQSTPGQGTVITIDLQRRDLGIE